ncbi:Alcohol dehydrogenase (plasmid) [Variovorax sp. SRS16]|uniref:NADPH:quinone oxidoreductase family protein n=1 Tax=Variovorax sp. SRS16 TaxID=282217 RepID=UPI001318E0BE|nr:NADPH:quinone oxidoreductase family protein [Variovorax sp. SRS16]VTU46332.1 Alcohol dehydrogenase [Variovorax sp. SRS16]
MHRVSQANPAGRRIVLPRYAQSQREAVDRVLVLEEIDPPRADSLKPDEVLVRIRSAAIAFADLLMLSGQYRFMPPLGGTPGLSYAGTVTAVGSNVNTSKMRVGDAVLGDFFRVGPRSRGEYRAAGGWASFAVAPEHGLHRMPGNLSFDQAANLLVNYETAYYALVTRGQLKPGETVLINGASGATGMAAVQLAKILGAKVIATGRSDAKRDLVMAFGADHFIATSRADGSVARFRDEVRALCGAEGAHMVYDTVGGDVSLESMHSLRFAGRHVIVGWISDGGGDGGHAPRNADQLPTRIIQLKGLYVMGSPTLEHAERDPQLREERLARIFGWAEAGLVCPFVSHAYPLEEFREAMRRKLNGDVVGSCVLNP